MNKSISIFFIFIFLSCNIEQKKTDNIAEILLVDSLDRPYEKLFLLDGKLNKSESYDTLGETYRIQRFENDTVKFDKFWNKEGFTTQQYSNRVMMIKWPIGEHYGELNYSSVTKFEQVKIHEQIKYYRPKAFRYDSSEIIDTKSKDLVFKNFDLNFEEPIRSRIVHYRNNNVISEDTVDGNYILRYRDKLIKTPYNNGEHP